MTKMEAINLGVFPMRTRRNEGNDRKKGKGVGLREREMLKCWEC